MKTGTAIKLCDVDSETLKSVDDYITLAKRNFGMFKYKISKRGNRNVDSASRIMV